MGSNWPRAYILGLQVGFRGAQLETQLHDLGIESLRVHGVDARTWSQVDIDGVYSRRASLLLLGREMGAGEIACAIGHQKLMHAFLASGEPWAFFFEDDVEIRSDLRPIVEHLPYLGQGPRIVLLESRNPFNPLDESRQRIEWAHGFLWKRANLAHGAGAYLISREAAELAARRYRRRRVDSVADWPAGWSRDVTFWQAEPMPVTHSTHAAGQSFLSQGRDEVVRARPFQNVTFARLLLSRLWRYSGLQMLYGLAIGVPPRDSLYRGILGPRNEKKSQRRSDPGAWNGFRVRNKAEESAFRFSTVNFAKINRRLPVSSIKAFSILLRILRRPEAAATYERLFKSLEPNFDPLRGAVLPPIDLLVVAAPKDFECLPLVIRGAIANVRNPIASASVVTTSHGLDAAREITKGIDCPFEIQVESEDDYIDSGSRALLRQTMNYRYGWLLQQFLNLAYALTRSGAGVLAIDADTVFLQPRAFVNASGTQILTPTYGVHDPYYELLDRVGVGSQPPALVFVPHFMLYQPDLVHQLFTSLAKGGIGSLISKVLASIDIAEPSPACVDFELYAQYLVREHPERAILARWSNTDAKASLKFGETVPSLQHLYRGWGSVSFHGYLPLSASD
jgi:glycosyl transferase family 25